MYNSQDILAASQMLGITFDKFSFNDLVIGTNIELEHGTQNPKTNVTNDNLIMTMKIALAHLNEFPDYYNKDYGLPALENYLKKKNRY